MILLWMVLVIVTAWEGPSASHDDYWYMKDTEVYLETGHLTGNQIYPAMLTANSIDPPPVLHNLPLMRLIFPLARILGSYWGWIAGNILFNLLSCLLILQIVYQTTNDFRQTILAGAMFLFSITTVHTSAHPISEAGITFFLLIGFLIFTYQNLNWIKILVGLLITVLMVLNRTSYILLIPFLLLILIKKKSYPSNSFLQRYRWAMGLIFLILFLSIYLSLRDLFPQVSLYAYAPFVIPPGGSMEHFFSLKPLPLRFDLIMHKISYGLKLQVTGRNLSHLPLLVLTNVLILSSIWGIFKNKFENKTKILLLGLMFVYLATICLVQYQTRFIHTLLPFLIIAWFIMGKDNKSIFLKWFTWGFIMISVIGSVINIKINHESALSTRATIQAMQTVRDKGIIDGDLLCYPCPKEIMYVFRDHRILMLHDKMSYTIEEIRAIRKRVFFRYMIARKNKRFDRVMKEFEPEWVMDLSGSMNDLALYRLKK